MPNLHSSMGLKALEYFGWEFAKGERENMNKIIKNRGILEAVVQVKDEDEVIIETNKDQKSGYSILEPKFQTDALNPILAKGK